MQKRFFTKFFPLMLLLVMLLGACSSAKTAEPGCLLLNGKNIAVDAVMTIDGHDISADMYRYQFLTLKAEAQTEDETWDEEIESAFKERVAEYLALMVAVEEMAGQYGISRGEDSAAYAAEQLEEVRSEYKNEKAFRTALAERYMTETQFTELLEGDYVQYKLYDALFGEEGRYTLSESQLVSMMKRDYVRVRYLKIGCTDENEAEKRAKAEELLKDIQEGLDFTEAVNTYGEESGMNGNPDGLYFERGMTSDETFEEACFSLKIDQISGVIQGKNAFYIIKRLPIDSEYVTDNADTFLDSYYRKLFSDRLIEMAKAYSVQYCEIYDQISVQSMG